MRFILALWLGKLVNLAIRLIDPSRGSNLPGQKAMALDPQLVAHFAVPKDRTLFITGTNGKSSMTHLLVHLARQSGYSVCTNPEGANLLEGVATALIRNTNWRGKLKTELCILETDERYLPLIYPQLPAGQMLITNLEKDQVQRNGDPDFIYRKLEKLIHSGMTLYLNNEDPSSTALASRAGTVHYYSVARNSESFTKDQSFGSRPDPETFRECRYDYYNLDSIGPFHIEGTGRSSLEEVEDQVRDIDFETGSFRFQGVGFQMPYLLPHMLYNYAGALCTAQHFLGLEIQNLPQALSSFVNIGGRYEVLEYAGKTIKYLRIKQENPDTLQSALNIIRQEPQDNAFLLSLDRVEDFSLPHYHNPFYAYDCDVQALLTGRTRRFVGLSESGGYDAGLYFRSSGIPEELIELQPLKTAGDILDYIAGLPYNTVYLIMRLGRYEELEPELARRQKSGAQPAQPQAGPLPSSPAPVQDVETARTLSARNEAGNGLTAQLYRFSRFCEDSIATSSSALRPVLRLARLCPNLLNLHGDRGNLLALHQLLRHASYDYVCVDVDSADLSQFRPSDFDLILVSPGDLSTLGHLASLLRGRSADWRDYIAEGGVLLVSGTSMALFAEQVQRLERPSYPGLGLLPINVEERRDIYGDDLVFETEALGCTQTLIGAQIQMADYRWRAESRASSGVQALGRILFGYGNSGDSQEEGFYLNKALFSNALGPLLIQNPRFALDLLKAALQHAFAREQGRPATAEEAEALQQQLQLPALTWEEEALRLKLDFISGKKNHLSNCDNRLLKDYSPKGRL